MKRYIPSSRTSTNSTQTEFLDNLSSEAQKMLTQLSQQFIRDLQSQTADLLRSSGGGAASAGSAGDTTGGLGTFTRILGTAARYLVQRPDKTSETTVQSDRSQTVDSQFRLSQSQAMAEATQTLGRGDKNL